MNRSPLFHGVIVARSSVYLALLAVTGLLCLVRPGHAQVCDVGMYIDSADQWAAERKEALDDFVFNEWGGLFPGSSANVVSSVGGLGISVWGIYEKWVMAPVGYPLHSLKSWEQSELRKQRHAADNLGAAGYAVHSVMMANRICGMQGFARSVMTNDPEAHGYPLMTQQERNDALFASSVVLFAAGSTYRQPVPGTPLTQHPYVSPQLATSCNRDMQVIVSNGNHRTAVAYRYWREGKLIGDDVIGMVDGRPLTQSGLAELFERQLVVSQQGVISSQTIRRILEEGFDPAKAMQISRLNRQPGIQLVRPTEPGGCLIGALKLEGKSFGPASGQTLDGIIPVLRAKGL